MTREVPPWLADFQSRFGEVLRTPLDRASGTLTATPEAYDPILVAGARDGPAATAPERLAVYNRQYWFRLFTLLQAAFPLTARLLGLWSFNGLAARFLSASPPRGWDLERAADGFDAFLEGALAEEQPGEPSWIEGVRVDAAWWAVLRAPGTVPFRPTAEDAARLLEARLLPSPSVAWVTEHFPLLALRAEILGREAESRIAPPPPLGEARAWALQRRGESILQIPLEPLEADLLTLLRALPVRVALARLEASVPSAARDGLPERVRGWLARSVERGFWIGLRDGAPGDPAPGP